MLEHGTGTGVIPMVRDPLRSNRIESGTLAPGYNEPRYNDFLAIRNSAS